MHMLLIVVPFEVPLITGISAVVPMLRQLVIVGHIFAVPAILGTVGEVVVNGPFGLCLLEELPVAAAVLPRVVPFVEVLMARVVAVVVLVGVIVLRRIVIAVVAVVAEVAKVALLVGKVIVEVLLVSLGGGRGGLLLGGLRLVLG